VNLDTRWNLNVGCGDGTGSGLGQVSNYGGVVLRGDNEVLDVQDYLNNVLFHTGDGGELVANALNSDVGDRCAWNRGEQGAAEGVS